MKAKNIHIKKLINARKAKQMSVSELARELQTSTMSIYHWEGERQHPSFITFLKWNKILGIKTIEL